MKLNIELNWSQLLLNSIDWTLFGKECHSAWSSTKLVSILDLRLKRNAAM